MQTQKESLGEFMEKVEEIVTLMNEGFGLSHEKSLGPHSPLVRWLDFRFRIVDTHPRTIYLSGKFPKALDKQTPGVFRALVEAIRNGDDINHTKAEAWFETVRLERSELSERTPLWADWGIHHLHVTMEFVGDSYFFGAKRPVAIRVVWN